MSAADCAVDGATGSQTGSWDGPFNIGAGQTQWQAHDLSDAMPVHYLDTILLKVTWTNDAASVVDFGIAMQTTDGLQSWNPIYQADLGEQSESILLERDDLIAIGWSGGDLRVGPSIETGGFGADDIPYTLSWEATFLDAACDDASVNSRGTGVAGGSGVPVQWWAALGLAIAAVVGTIAYSTRK